MKSIRIARIIPNIIWKKNVPCGASHTEVWVFGILKSQLLKLGVTIIKSKNYQGDWGFLLSVKDGEKVREMFPK